MKRKQLKITKLFKKNASRVPEDEDVDDLMEEVKGLELKLREKQNELFQLQRDSCRKKASPVKQKDDAFVRPQKIILANSVDSLKRKLELVSMLTSTEVQSYVAGEHCCIVFHMQHESEHAISHGLRIEMDSGKNEIAASSLPLGFNLSAVMDGFDNVMKPECLVAIRKALVAYYDRLGQFERLKKLLNIEAEVFKTLDASYIEIKMFVQPEQTDAEDPDQDPFSITLALQYRVYDIRPKTYDIKDEDRPEGADEVLKAQCAVFKKKPLYKAFREAFLSEIGQFRMVQQSGRGQLPARGPRRPRPAPHPDDTFRPEDCSDHSDDDDYRA